PLQDLPSFPTRRSSDLGCIQAGQAPTGDRLRRWLRARVQVPGRPDWFFVKLHTHGAKEANQRVLLGESMTAFHESLAQRAAEDRSEEHTSELQSLAYLV